MADSLVYIDTHCHFDAAEFALDRDAEYARAWTGGVITQIIPAIARDNFADVEAVCARYAGCLPAWGLHPMLIAAHRPEHLVQLREYVERHRPVAIGEIGLDFFVRGLDAVTQEYFYVEQLKLAQEYNLPVLLHSRKSVDQLLKQLRRIRVCGGIAHAFNGSPQQAEMLIRLGFKLGFGGAFTWPRANNLRRLAVNLPLESIVLETDSPDIAPVWLGKARNSPAELPRIAETLAELRGISVATVSEVTTANARAVLALESSWKQQITE